MSERVQVIGADRLASTLGDAADALSDFSEPAQRAAVLIARAARSRAPRRSGRLGSSLVATAGVVSSQVIYAGVIHYGWSARRISGDPFLTDAATATEPSWLPLYADRVDAALALVKGA